MLNILKNKREKEIEATLLKMFGEEAVEEYREMRNHPVPPMTEKEIDIFLHPPKEKIDEVFERVENGIALDMLMTPSEWEDFKRGEGYYNRHPEMERK